MMSVMCSAVQNQYRLGTAEAAHGRALRKKEAEKTVEVKQQLLLT